MDFNDKFFKLIFFLLRPITITTNGRTKVNKKFCPSKRNCGNSSYKTRKYIANTEKIIIFRLLSFRLNLEKIVDGRGKKST